MKGLNLHFKALRNKNVDYVNVLFFKYFIKCFYIGEASLDKINIETK